MIPAGSQVSAKYVALRGEPATTPVALALSAYLWLYPLVWLTGLDGFLWLALLPLLLLAVFSGSDRGLRMPPLVASGLALFFIGFLVSGFGVQSTVRYLTWARDGLIVVWAVIVAALVRGTPRIDAERLFLLPVAVALVFACAAGLLAVALGEPLELKTLAWHLLPGGIRGTEFAERQTIKILYQDSWFAGVAYPRVRSFFMYGNNLGQAAAGFLLLFVAARLWKVRILYVVAAGIVAVVLPLTTSRSAFLGLLVGLLALAVLRGGAVLRGALLVLSLAAGLWMLANWPAIEAAMDAFSSLRGGGSRNARLQIYEGTLAGILENPLGHGTQRDVMYLDFPLGSHSSILGVLYKFGVLGGIGLFLAVAGLCFRFPAADRRITTATLALFAGFFVFAVFEELYLDVTVATMLAVFVGMLSTAAPGPSSSPASRP